MTVSGAAAALGFLLFPLAVVYAGFMDFVTMKIRNRLVLGLAAAWVVLAPLAGFSASELGLSLATAGFVFVVSFALFAFGWIGGGDAKLATVTALWFAPGESLQYFAIASFLGGLLTLAILHFRTGPVPAFLYGVPWLAHLQDPKAGVPYGAAMAPAALIVFPETEWLIHAFR